MPWPEVSIMESREEFCRLAMQEGATMRALCRRFGISPTTGYRWVQRYQAEGRTGLIDRSRRPHRSPARTSMAMEEQVLAVRGEHPRWGGRKIRAVLQRTGMPSPSASTITAILARHDRLDPEQTPIRTPLRHFEAPFPNDLWQMDFKGHFALTDQSRCHPMTVLDDHSRYALGLRALGNEQETTVRRELIRLFERYGLPNRILCDNGSPWGSSPPGSYTALMVWLLRLDVRVIHGHPYHPQTQGKDERFHRTLQEEVVDALTFASLDHVQQRFDAWRAVYNHQRPHEALDLAPPITRYVPSPRSYPARLPPIEYPDDPLVRMVTSRGAIKFRGKKYYLGDAFSGYPVAVRPTTDDALYQVSFRHYPVGMIDLRMPLPG